MWNMTVIKCTITFYQDSGSLPSCWYLWISCKCGRCKLQYISCTISLNCFPSLLPQSSVLPTQLIEVDIPNKRIILMFIFEGWVIFRPRTMNWGALQLAHFFVLILSALHSTHSYSSQWDSLRTRVEVDRVCFSMAMEMGEEDPR